MRAYHYRIPVEGIDGKPAALPATARQSGTSGSYEITVNGLSIAELTRIKAATGHPLHVGIVERVAAGAWTLDGKPSPVYPTLEEAVVALVQDRIRP